MSQEAVSEGWRAAFPLFAFPERQFLWWVFSALSVARYPKFGGRLRLKARHHRRGSARYCDLDAESSRRLGNDDVGRCGRF